jgi:hypothetical protein
MHSATRKTGHSPTIMPRSLQSWQSFESKGVTSKRDKAAKQIERERRIGAIRAGVRLNVEYERDIRELESERDALADEDDRSGFNEFVSSERGRRLADFYQRRTAYERGQLSVSRLAPVAPRNSYLQEAILEALADRELIFAGRILTRLGVVSPTSGQRTCASRALRGLLTKALVEAWKPNAPRPGKGYLWGLRANGARRAE